MITDYVIIVAGGKGLRMGGEVPKQFLPVEGIPVLMRTLMRFHKYALTSSSTKEEHLVGEVNPRLQIILVLPHEQQDYWRELCQQHHFPLPHEEWDGSAYLLADGGSTRFHSVKNGLDLIPNDAEGVVGVHDGVRPFVAVEVIGRCFDAARQAEAVIPVVPVVETLRHVERGNVFRDEYRLVQTPQTFSIQLLKAAFSQPYRNTFTDDASVVEAYGRQVTMVEGNRENIKITTPFDMLMARMLV